VDVTGLLADGPGPALGQRRAEVLEALCSAGTPLRVQEVARRTGVHANTARFHLDALVDAGLATREAQARAAPGRPSFAYRAVAHAPVAGHRQYRLLAEMLSSLIEGLLPDPGQAAVQAGREWGRFLTERPAPYQRITAAEAVSRLLAVLAEIGFAPETGPAAVRQSGPEGGSAHAHQFAQGSGPAWTQRLTPQSRPADARRLAPETGPARAPEVWLRRCPFREVAEHRRDVVCQLHLGLMQGVLDQLHAPVTAARIHPFAEPSLCIAELATVPAPG
jgi:predicted ArsR family transcriptional regulator